jgi:phosphotransferase system enzyme I (PtsI)
MGVSSLSMAAAAVPGVGSGLAATSIEVCKTAAQAALDASDPAAARQAVRGVLA